MTPPLEGKDGNIQLKLSGKTIDAELPPQTALDDDDDDDLQALELLIGSEEQLVNNLLEVAKIFVPKMLGNEGVRKSKTTGKNYFICLTCGLP